MTNGRVGMIGAAVAGASVAIFAGAMVIALATGLDTSPVSYFVCIFIAVGYIMFAAAFVSPRKDRPLTAAGLTGLAFAAAYALLIFIVYFAMLTTVRMNSSLGKEALSIISFAHLGSLFFNYDLLGYGFMGLSTFFVGFTVAPKTKGDRVLRGLLWMHGIFFFSGLLMPMFPIFTADMEGGAAIGSAVLLVWCAYFLPVCILGWRYFRRIEHEQETAW